MVERVNPECATDPWIVEVGMDEEGLHKEMDNEEQRREMD